MLCLRVGMYQISAIPKNFVLQQRKPSSRGDNKGKEITVDLGYYSSLESALVALQKEELAESDATDVVLLLEVLHSSEQRIKDAVREQCG